MIAFVMRLDAIYPHYRKPNETYGYSHLKNVLCVYAYCFIIHIAVDQICEFVPDPSS